ncbi:MAG: ABC transporter ATP-binding protein [Myxococcales bacterium]|jgi:multiple sugar transport system ATP-binding protein
MAQVVLDKLVKRYGDAPPTVKEVSLTVNDGEFLVLVGPSGCGKSTTLRMIAGLEEITAGELRIGERRVNEVHPKDRDIAMVFQSYALYPHMTVRENMAFGLKMRGMPKSEIDARVNEAAKMLDLEHLLDRKPKAMSGGQRQRVAMGRAIVRRAPVFLFDEPLSNLDAKLRVQMRAEIARLHQKLKMTVIYVTHDQTEAMTLADRIAVMHAGILQQLATPLELYEKPANRFVAGFIGSPSMNFCDAAAGKDGVLAFGARLPLPERLGSFSGSCVAGVRPEHFVEEPAEGRVAVPVTVELVEPLGSETYLTCKCNDEKATRIIARVGPRCPANDGEKFTLYVDPKRLYLFAPGDNGAAL